jgi:hypothetical protein
VELYPTGRSQSPVGCLIPNEQVLLCRDGMLRASSLSTRQLLNAAADISIFTGFDGKTTRKFGLSWSETPICMGRSPFINSQLYKSHVASGHFQPYVVAILSKFLEVRTTFGTQTLVQTIPLRGARFLTLKDDIYVAAQNQIWRLLPVPILEQVEQLVRDREYEEALSLCEHLTGPEEAVKVDSLCRAAKSDVRCVLPAGSEASLHQEPLQLFLVQRGSLCPRYGVFPGA